MLPIRVNTILTGALLVCCLTGTRSLEQAEGDLSAGGNPDAVCASCHQDIYTRYERTPMARASGPAIDGLLAGEFSHAASGIRYTLSLGEGRAWLSYERPGATAERELNGRRELLYYVGSGKRGRTYLFQREGFWFESPVNWYAKQQLWDMAPSQTRAREMPLTMPVGPDCLHCHASAVQPSLPGSRNHYAGQPFLHSGIGCESCHGDPSGHLATAGKEPLLDPAKLSPVRRDSICLQCHLEGETSVARLGYSMNSFKPGDNLFDQAIYFIHDQQKDGAQRSTSQWEALLLSVCKRKSGDRLTCTTCHDPHGSPSPGDRVAYYRGKCLSCHNGATFIAKHHPGQPDCASCHMPRAAAQNVAHEQVTDHRIQRRPGLPLQPQGEAAGRLVTVGNIPASDRDFGLAYAQLATHGDRSAIEPALKYLRAGERAGPAQSGDVDLHTELGFLEQVEGDKKQAEQEYRQALRADVHDGTAAGDLALLEAQGGDLASAARLWQAVFQDDPTQIAAGFNLAVAQCSLGDHGAAGTLARVLSFSPDDAKARQMQRSIAASGCTAR